MSYCCCPPQRRTGFYNIQNVKERFILTYYHTPIFASAPEDPKPTHCTPSYHSQAIMPAQRSCKASKRPTSCSKLPKSTYKADYRKGREGDFYNNAGNCLYNSSQLWYDPGKSEYLHRVSSCPKERKKLDLASSQVFQTYSIEPCTIEHCQYNQEHIQAALDRKLTHEANPEEQPPQNPPTQKQHLPTQQPVRQVQAKPQDNPKRESLQSGPVVTFGRPGGKGPSQLKEGKKGSMRHNYTVTRKVY